MAAFSDKTSRRVSGPKAPKVKLPSGQNAHELAQRLQELRDEYGQDTFVNVLNTQPRGNNKDGLGQKMEDGASQYPVRLYQPDPYDTNVALKRSAPDDFGHKVLTSDDLEWMRRKQDQMTAAQFKLFVGQMYNKNDPAQLALLHKVYPELLNEQMEIINDRFELMKQLTKIKLHGGPQNSDDLRLLFALQSGAIAPPTGDMWDPSSWKEKAADAPAAMKRGLFSPVKVVDKFGAQNQALMPFDALKSVLPGSRTTNPTVNEANGYKSYFDGLK